MEKLERLFSQPTVRSVSVGQSALKWHDKFCAILVEGSDSPIQAFGSSIEEAVNNATLKMMGF